MFEINLIRERIIPAKQKNIIVGLISVYLLICVLSVSIVSFLCVANVRMIQIYKGRLINLEREISAVYPGRPTVEELKIMWNKLFPELTGISNLLGRRILWGPKLNQISSSLPKGVWIDELRSARQSPEEIVSRKKGKNKSAPTKSRQQNLIIEGRVVSDSDKKGTKAIKDFVSSLKENALFMEDIESVELVATEKRTTGARPIRAFQIRCRFDNRRGL